MYKFNAKFVKDELVTWIREWFDKNGSDCNAVLGISGGKDSSIVAALLVEALGKERVIGILMPNGTQSDIQDSKDLVQYLGIKSYEVNIGDYYFNMVCGVSKNVTVDNGVYVNLPVYLRMSVLACYAKSCNGRVIGTGNLSEFYVGYFTKAEIGYYDVEPILSFTVREVKALGRECGLPDRFIDKVPADGLSDKTDEDNLGFSYDDLDEYIREDTSGDKIVDYKIKARHEMNRFKMLYVDHFWYLKDIEEYIK